MNVPEDNMHHEAGHTPGVVPDWVLAARAEGRSVAYRGPEHDHGPAVNALLLRETRKEATLRARLADLGIERMRRDRCFVHAAPKAEDDMALLPWSVIFDLLNGDYATFYDGAMGAER